MNILRMVLLVLVASVLPASSCINQKYAAGVRDRYVVIKAQYVKVLDERGRLTRAFFVEKLGAEKGAELWAALAQAEYGSDEIKIFKRDADALQALIEEPIKEK